MFSTHDCLVQAELFTIRQNFRLVQNVRICRNKNDDEMIWAALGRVVTIMGKGENAGYHHFLLFPQCFQKASFPELLKVRIVW